MTEDIDIFCIDRKCPICNKKMEILKYKTMPEEDVSCINDCYSVISRYDQYFVYIFGDFQIMMSKNNIDKEIEKSIVEKINYWKENDRYLVEILSRE